MNKHIFNYLMLGGMALLMSACSESESKLLEPKVYFENKEQNLLMEDESDVMTFNLTSRLSTMTNSQVDVSYSIADPSVIDEYNAKYGTTHLMLDASNVKLSSKTSTIPGGKLYADNVTIELSELGSLKEGKSYVLPVCVQSSSVPTLSGTSIAYFFLTKPIKITKVGKFNSSHISIKFPVGTYFQSFTYETLLYLTRINNNNTIMGTEGIMIFRIGDAPGVPKDVLEAAGNQNYHTTEKVKTGKWYHVALTYDQPTGRTAIYVDGSKWAESNWGIPGFDPNADVGFNIGKIPNFPWGTRPLYGWMSEVRVWSVARTENQLKQNMLGVDPASEGLELYFKLNGSEKQENGTITDAASGIVGTTSGITIETLDAPIAIN